MLFKWLYMYMIGTVNITVEGFFIERFMNICKNENIILWESKFERGTILRLKISKSDFKKIRHIARKTSCRVSLDEKHGLEFFMRKYKKRKIFAIACLVIAIFCFSITRFIWNIELVGNENIDKEEIIANLAEYGIKEGKLKYGIDLEKIKNEMRLKQNDLAWIGIDIKGTNVIVTVVETTKEPKIIDEYIPSNIFADNNGIVSKIVVRSGTARINVRRYCFRRRFTS